MAISKYERAARLLFDARRTNIQMAELPNELRPIDREEAFRIQDAFVAIDGGAVGWWKVQPFDNNGRNCSPLFAADVHPSPARLRFAKIPLEIEVEVAIVMATDMDDMGKRHTAADAREAIASLHTAIEIVSSRFVDRKAVQPLSAVADLMSGTGIVLGDSFSDWRSLELGGLSASLSIDGRKVGTPGGSWTTSEMLESIAALANQAATRPGGGLKAGHVVMTGARMKPHLAQVGVKIEGRVGSFKPAELVIET